MTTQQPPQKHPIQTQHCRFCNHLLLATTRTLSTLPRRGEGAQDKAIILPLENGDTDADMEAETEIEAEIEIEGEGKSPFHEDQPEATTATANKNTVKPKTGSKTKHTTLLLPTTIPDKRATLIRREDGIEKRILLRCGRCRVVVGYYLDQVHWESARGAGGNEDELRPRAVYLLPGAVVETAAMGGEGIGEREWRDWDV